jgi:hypothetical protein
MVRVPVEEILDNYTSTHYSKNPSQNLFPSPILLENDIS